jgi:hypothetical protein
MERECFEWQVESGKAARAGRNDAARDDRGYRRIVGYRRALLLPRPRRHYLVRMPARSRAVLKRILAACPFHSLLAAKA